MFIVKDVKCQFFDILSLLGGLFNVHFDPSGLMQEALMANPYETLNVATALDRALKVSNKHKFE